MAQLARGCQQQAQRHIRHVFRQCAGGDGDRDAVLPGITQVNGVGTYAENGNQPQIRQLFQYRRSNANIAAGDQGGEGSAISCQESDRVSLFVERVHHKVGLKAGKQAVHYRGD
ncbi:hypothetical protein D3C79_899580 [compost metagenome]